MKKEKFDIDFVVLWVDGSDPDWLNKRKKYLQDKEQGKTVRFRDYGTFKFWFRAVEQFTPWVHKVYLVTDNQVPDWLDESNNKIEVIDHTQIISKKFLPTFNSNAIELNLNKIPGLSEHFVAFNDDMFINKRMKPSDFFDKSGLPRDSAVQNAIMPVEDFDHMTANNIAIINQRFDKYKIIKKNFSKFFSIKYGYFNMLSILLLPWPRFTRFFDFHIPISVVKSVFNEVAHDNPDAILTTSRNRFRDKGDNTFWLVRYYQLATGRFKPRTPFIGKKYNLKNIAKISNDIEKSHHKMICINDQEISDGDFLEIVTQLRKTFIKKLPNKSSFEK